jgi:hypothetical protein
MYSECLAELYRALVADFDPAVFRQTDIRGRDSAPLGQLLLRLSL